MKRVILFLAACAVIGAGGFWVLTMPGTVSEDFDADLTADGAAGALIYAAGGCASCHAAPNAEGDQKDVLVGGVPFASDFGTFYAPNISNDPEFGIGAWSNQMFARALTKGVSPDGAHYYPAFPYTAYGNMTAQDVVDLRAHLRTLPSAETPSKPHDVGFPFNIRRGLGLWKLLFGNDGYVLSGELTEQVQRGRYLAEALGHCGECHTPRNVLGGLDRGRWLAGAPNPSGKGRIPNITPAKMTWSEADLVEYFTSGFTPEFDTAGGEMTEVISNLSQLPEADRAAIAAYLKALPAVE